MTKLSDKFKSQLCGSITGEPPIIEDLQPEDYNLDLVSKLAMTNHVIYAAIQAHRYGQLQTCEQYLCFAILELHKQNQELVRVAEDLIKNNPPVYIIQKDDSTL